MVTARNALRMMMSRVWLNMTVNASAPLLLSRSVSSTPYRPQCCVVAAAATVRPLCHSSSSPCSAAGQQVNGGAVVHAVLLQHRRCRM